LLEELSKSDEAMAIQVLAGAVFSLQPDDLGNFAPSRSQRVSIHRALKKLAGAGTIHQLNRHFWGTHDHRVRWEEERPPGREYRQALRNFCAEMERRYDLHLSPADAEKLFDRHSAE
jgi:hypothetical protein